MKEQKLKLNVRLLRRVQKHIKAEPRRMKMKQWVDRNLRERAESAKPPCGTTACIAGWALTLNGKRLRDGVNYMEQGRKLLGLTWDEARNLFMVDDWPTKFQNKYDEESEQAWKDNVPLKLVRKNARVAVARIEHFIKHRK
jgi:hypothetical protein